MKVFRLLVLVHVLLLAVSCKPEAVAVSVTSVTLNATSLSMTEGESVALKAEVSPYNADNQNLTWTSSNTDMVTVSDGVVTAVAEGYATVTVKTEDGGKTASCAVSVKPKVITVKYVNLDINAVTLYPSEERRLMVTLYPDDAVDKTVVWSSSDESVAIVEDGLITAVSSGTAVVTAISNGKEASCKVTVVGQPLTFTASGESSVRLTKSGSPYKIDLQFKKDGGTWEAYTIGQGVSLSDGESVSFRAAGKTDGMFSLDEGNWYHFEMTGQIYASGNIMSLLDFYQGMDSLTRNCFTRLFEGCTRLVTAPDLPADNLAYGCYSRLFSGCTDLVQAPELPASYVEEGSYAGMFSGCTSLQDAPELPASHVGNYGYFGMFGSCRSLVKAPELPAKELGYACYSSMFSQCESLEIAPVLPALELAPLCYERMFESCVRLPVSPTLPALMMENDCYAHMFAGCVGLVSAGDILATTASVHSCEEMFYGCTSIEETPRIFTVNLKEACFRGMFRECTSLKRCPSLPAEKLARSCYFSMFYGCNSLNYVKASFNFSTLTDPYAPYDVSNWMEGVAPEGTFVRNPDSEWTPAQAGIPEGWTVIEDLDEK